MDPFPENRVEQILQIVQPVSSVVILVVVGIVLWIIWKRGGDPYQPPVQQVKDPITGLLTNVPVQSVVLPKAGSIKGPGLVVNPQTNLLVFRSKSISTNVSDNGAGRWDQPFNLGSPDNTCPASVKACTPTDRWNQLVNAPLGGLYSQQQASQYNLPWPPEAGAQLAQQQNQPNLPESLTNPLLPAANSPLAQPSNQNAFVRVQRLSGTPYQKTKDLTTPTTLNSFQFVFAKTGLVQIEAAGGSGGDFWTGGSQQPNSVKYRGGRNGIVWAQCQVQPGDTWQVQVSQSGGSIPNTGNLKEDQLNVAKNVTSTEAAISGGGTGSFLAGSEGGGLTQVSSKVPNSGDVTPANVLLAAGGGGGASRNAFGGSAGNSYFLWDNPDALPAFGQAHPNQQSGAWPGGPRNVIDYKDVLPINQQQQRRGLNELSGGGATPGQNGVSQTPSDLPSVPDEDRSLLASEASGTFLKGGSGLNNPPGGGGGGAGFYGGGSGIWNSRRAPNNEHGAGGGGSSQVSSFTKFRSTTGQPCANPFQNSTEVPTGIRTWANTSQLTTFPNFDAKNQFLLAVPMD